MFECGKVDNHCIWVIAYNEVDGLSAVDASAAGGSYAADDAACDSNNFK